MIIVKNLTKYINHDLLWEDISFVLHRGDKVGLVGRNGCGKSTLLKIIAGSEEADEGRVSLEQERIGYVPQNIEYSEIMTIEEYLRGIESVQAEKMLKKTGLEELNIKILVKALSGGQKTRLGLAKVLAAKPTVLLLDEPTNNLDIEGLEWLETIIGEFNGIVLVVSHDRRLLDRVVNKIWEIDDVNFAFNQYLGGYTQYQEARRQKMLNWEKDYNLQQKEKKRLENLLALKRQEASVFSDPAKGRQVRALEKRIQREIYDQYIVKPKDFEAMADLRFNEELPSSKLVLRAENLCKSFADKPIIMGIDLEVRGRERVLLAGKNGSGKSTLLKMIVGEIAPDKGEVRIGANLWIGYFAQGQETLNLEKDVLTEFLSTNGIDCGISRARTILGAFMFPGDDIYKKVGVLSYGERVRLMFAKLVNQGNQFLILDEPTNHLDIPSREVVEEALNTFKGALLFVSHDRYFIDKIGVDRVINLIDGQIN